MRTLRDPDSRNKLAKRLQKLSSDSKPSWGRMNADQMLSHLVQAGEMPFTASVPERSTWMSRNVIKPLVLYVMPIPKEVKTFAEMDQQQDGRKPCGFDADRARVVELMERLGTLARQQECLAHPFFGPMPAKEWAVLAHTHRPSSASIRAVNGQRIKGNPHWGQVIFGRILWV